MKQNNTRLLFKNLALCFLMLGNLIFDVSCNVPSNPPDPIIAPVTAVKGKVPVPKDYVCNIIKKYYERVKNGDYFKTLVGSVPTYNFKFNSSKDGKGILSEKIKAVSGQTPNELFNDFQAEVKKVEESINQITTPKPISADNFCTFMNGFFFNNNKFESAQCNGYCVSLNAIADNLVVYLNCTLEELKDEIAKSSAKGTIDSTLMKTLIDAEVNLANNHLNVQTALDDTLDDTLNDAKNAATYEVYKQANAAFKNIVLGKIATVPTSTPTSLNYLLQELGNYQIKIVYNYTAASIPTNLNKLPSYGDLNDAPTLANASTLASTATTLATAATTATTPSLRTAPAPTVEITYSIVESSKITSYSIPNTSFSEFAINAFDIADNIKFIHAFIDTSNVLAKDVFVAISEICSTAGNNANEHLKAILPKLNSNFTNTVNNALSKCRLEKTVSKDDFNEAFKFFDVIESVDVKESDIKTENLNLCWLSDVNEAERFSKYIDYLEHAKPSKFSVTQVKDNDEAVTKFFEILKDNLGEYIRELESSAKDIKKKTEEDAENAKKKAEEDAKRAKKTKETKKTKKTNNDPNNDPNIDPNNDPNNDPNKTTNASKSLKIPKFISKNITLDGSHKSMKSTASPTNSSRSKEMPTYAKGIVFFVIFFFSFGGFCIVVYFVILK